MYRAEPRLIHGAMQWTEGETYVLIEPAVAEISRRRLPREMVTGVIEGPEQVVPVRPGRVIHQSRYVPEDDDQVYFLMVVIDVDRRPAEVVTAYRTSRVFRYWRRSE